MRECDTWDVMWQHENIFQFDEKRSFLHSLVDTTVIHSTQHHLFQLNILLFANPQKIPHIKYLSGIMTESQKAFETCWKSDKKNSSHPLMLLEMSGQEFKFMDVRPDENHGPKVDPETGLLHYEIFWSGELEKLNQETFRTTVAEVLVKYGANLNGTMREAGCMISMVALPFTIEEEKAMELGRDMFDDFGEIPDKDEAKKEEKKPDPKKQKVVSSKGVDETASGKEVVGVPQWLFLLRGKSVDIP